MRKLIIATMILSLNSVIFAQELTTVVPSMWEIVNAENRTFNVSSVEVLNSKEQDYCAFEFWGGILFSSTRTGKSEEHKDDSNFYFTNYSSDGGLEQPAFYKSPINSVLKEGVASISPNGNEMIFSRSEPGTKRVHLYSAEYVNGQWQNISKLKINVDGYLSGHPTYSADGTKIYFASNRPGGIGGTDLYYSVKTDMGWEEPVNLGPSVNSDKNELYPFMDHNSVLYFSSNRVGSNGGLDIYMTVEKSSNLWEVPINMDLPFNSPEDDFGIYVSPDKTEGFLSSSRVGGLGGSDIYRWKMEECISISGQLIDATNQALAINDISISINEIDQDKFLYTTTNETGSFNICLPCDKDFSFKVSPEGYYQKIIFVSTKEKDCLSVNNINVAVQLFELQVSDVAQNNPNTNELKSTKPLTEEEIKIRDEKNKVMLESISIAEEGEDEPEKIETETVERLMEEEPDIIDKTVETIDNTAVNVFPVMPSIYHDFNSFQISPKDQEYLDDLANYLNENLNVELLINSYTDTRGRSVYNNWLSDQRANVVQGYLINKGVDASRIMAEGKGEDVKSDNFTESRRTEFSLLNKNKEFSSSEIIATQVTKIHYGFDAYHLDRAARQQVETVIEQLLLNPDWKVTVVSHTDSRGSKVYNRKLSEKRAKQVMKFMMAKGISEDRVSVEGKGETELINECMDGIDCSRTQHLENRRTEFIFRTQNG